MTEPKEIFFVSDNELVVQPADESELGGNGGQILRHAQDGAWTATITFDPDKNSTAMIALSEDVADQEPVWHSTGVTLLSDVNVLCLISRSKFPSNEQYEKWWGHAVDSLQNKNLVSVVGGILMAGSDGVPSELWLWRQAETIVGVLVTLPEI